ncbi:COMPASS (complex proteins associated with Set1p) component [Rhinocladiella similis]
MDATDPSVNFFAPELFQQEDDAPLPHDSLRPLSHDVDMNMIDQDGDVSHISGLPGDLVDPGLVKQEMVESNYPPLDDEPLPVDSTTTLDMVDESLLEDDSSLRGSPEQSAKKPKTPGKPRKPDPGAPPKSHVHSSKNEGQHTDRRYLCYLCNKLFTRRRSVRDHISKIHNTKTWEPLRSLEVIVEPITGEPLEPLEDIIARGPPPPPPKLTKAQKAEKQARREEEEADGEGEPDRASVAGEQEQSEERNVSHAPEPQVAEASTPQPTSSVMTLKKEPSVAGSRASSTEPFATPAPVAGKKRPAPDDSAKSSAAAKKKGTVKVKTSTAPNKRSKLSESENSPPARSAYRSPSATPVSTLLKPIPSKLKKQTSAASVKSSPTPASSRAASIEVRSRSSSVADTPGSSNDDGEIFCICRKGDNHTWMIACDGGCEEWFHGNCVNIRERDGDLIDKYICPRCAKPGLQTTWKRMCRRKDCRKPARVMQDPPSKYCSDACGRMFFVELVQRGDPNVQISRDGQYIVEAEKPKKLRKKHKKTEGRSKMARTLNNVNGDVGTPINNDSRLATPAYSDEEKTEYETDSSLDDDMLPNRGSTLRAGEVKALLEKCRDVEEWRALGRKPETPPRDVDMPDADAKADTDGIKPESARLELEFDELESAKMVSIQEDKRKLNEQNDMLSARELLLELVKMRSGSITDEVKKSHPKMKDVCGFDPRMAWSDEEFGNWYLQRGGKEILDQGIEKAKIGPPEDSYGNVVNGIGEHDGGDGGGDGDENTGNNEDTMPKKGGVCIKNRCPRHRNWAKSQLAELRFEQDLVRRQLGRCEAQEQKMKERATVRAWEKRGLELDLSTQGVDR